MKLSTIAFSTLSLLSISVSPVKANSLDSMDGFAFYAWKDGSGTQTRHKSVIWMESKSPRHVILYSTTESYPLGQSLRCGGVGCNLEKSKAIGSITANTSGSHFRVQSTASDTKFLKGASCSITEDRVTTKMTCRSSNTPPGFSSDSEDIFEFSLVP